MIKISIFNLILRSLTLASKFILMLFIARNFSPEDLGIFGIMSVSTTLLLFIVGLDFYIFNTREILAREKTEIGRLIRDQFVFHCLVYILILPFCVFLFEKGLLPWKYIFWFYLILIFEHLAQEANRLFITISRPIMANIILFFRSGAWVYAVILFYTYKDSSTNLSWIWLGWTIGGFISLCIAVYGLREINWHDVKRHSVEWNWIMKGIKDSIPFFGATLALKVLEYADRYFIKYYHGEAIVGVYTFYANIANVVQVFIFTGIISILYPKVIDSYQKGLEHEYNCLMKKLTLMVLISTILLTVLAGVGIFPVIFVIKKQIYFEYISSYFVLLISVAISVVSQIPHYGLYARKKDKAIWISSLVAVIVALLMNRFMVPSYGIIGASISTLVGMTILGLIKLLALRKYKQKNLFKGISEV